MFQRRFQTILATCSLALLFFGGISSADPIEDLAFPRRTIFPTVRTERVERGQIAVRFRNQAAGMRPRPTAAIGESVVTMYVPGNSHADLFFDCNLVHRGCKFSWQNSKLLEVVPACCARVVCTDCLHRLSVCFCLCSVTPESLQQVLYELECDNPYVTCSW